MLQRPSLFNETKGFDEIGTDTAQRYEWCANEAPFEARQFNGESKLVDSNCKIRHVG